MVTYGPPIIRRFHLPSEEPLRTLKGSLDRVSSPGRLRDRFAVSVAVEDLFSRTGRRRPMKTEVPCKDGGGVNVAPSHDKTTKRKEKHP